MAAPEPIPDLLKAVNEASGRSFALWVTFLTVSLYLAIAVGTTTHVQLLLEAPVKLPLLAVDLPLYAFYGVAPALFFVLHLYVLTQLCLLSQSLQLFDAELQAAQVFHQVREQTRMQLDKFVLTQLLAGAPSEWLTRQLLRWTTWLSLLVAPVVLLLFFQLKFLPYHSIEITWAHRSVVLLDLLLIGVMWPKISNAAPRSEGTRIDIDRGVGRGALMTACITLPALFSVFVATVPDDAIEKVELGLGWPIHESLNRRAVWWPTWALFEGEIDPVLSRTKSGFGLARNLVLIDAKLIDTNKLSKPERTLSLRGRDLRLALLNGADLRKADLLGSRLQGAYLIGAQLQGASLVETQLQGAFLNGAHLEGANLGLAQLQGASLDFARLQGASLEAAQLQGTSLDHVQLQGASLKFTRLQGASLANAQLEGAGLSDAQLQGALLDGAELQGAQLVDVQLEGASLQRAHVWRARLVPEGPTRLVDARNIDLQPMQDAAIAELVRNVEIAIPGGSSRHQALRRMAILSAGTSAEEPGATTWRELRDRGWDDTTEATDLSEVLANLACEPANAPYVGRALLRRLRGPDNGPLARSLAKALRDQKCSGVPYLTPDEKEHLEAIIIGPLHREQTHVPAFPQSEPEQFEPEIEFPSTTPSHER